MNFDMIATELWAQAAPKQGQGGLVESLFTGPWGMFILFAFIGVMFLMLIVQPERRKQAEHKKLLESIKPNDRVVTIGGLYVTIVQVPKESNELIVRIDESNNTKMRIARSAISKVLRPDDAE